MQYVVIDDVTYPIDTLEEIAVAKQAMRELEIAELEVWYTPATLDSVLEIGDPDGYVLSSKLFAD